MNEAKKPARILVVDDEERNRRLLAAMLEAEGYSASEAADGTRALELARRSPPDLILLDIMMPGIDGYEVARALKTDAATKAIPVVMVTALDDRASRLRGLEAGAEEFVIKPVDRNELRIRVRNLLRLKEFSDFLANHNCILEEQVRERTARLTAEIAERKRIEEEQARLVAIIEATPDMVATGDSNGHVLYYNPAGLRMLGFEPGLDVSTVRFLDTHPEWAAKLVAETGIPHAIEHGTWSGETALLSGDGREIPVIQVIIAHKGPDGAVEYLSTIMRDITQRKEQEAKVARLSRIHAVLSGINSLIVRVGNRQELFNGACRIAVEQGGFGIAWVGVLNQETLDVTPVACAGIDGDSFLGHGQNTVRPDTSLSQNLVNRAIREKRAMFSNDLTKEAGGGGERRKEAIRRGYRSAIALPLLMEEAVAGNLSLFAKEANFFDADEVKLLTELAGDISFALENIARQEKLDKLSRIRAVSGEINAAIVRVRERDLLLKETCRIAVEHGKFELVWIGALDPEQQKIQPVVWAGFSPEAAHSVSWATIDAARGAQSEAIRTRQPAVNNDIGAGGQSVGILRQEAIEKGCRSMVSLPLVVDDKVVAICALFATGRGFFDADERALLDELAADVSFALAYIAKEEKLNYLAYYDALTGLSNRALFDDRMTQVLRAASHENNKTALVLIDLERFRIINDTLGRTAADELLKLVAQRLQSVIFDRDSLARVEGDVFAGLFPDIRDESDIAHIVEEKIFGCLNQPFTIAGQQLRVSAKIGVAMFPGDAREPDALFSSAGAALKQAKGSSDRYLFYARKMNAQVAERLKLESKLQRAIELEQFVLFYQPKVDLGTGRVAGLEALIRWNDPETGLVMPMLFIPLLEETGMIVEVGAWAMKQAVTQYAAWQAAGLQPPPIAVNVSAVQLKRRDFVASVEQAIAIAGKPDHGLDLEITESMIMEDIEASIEKLKLVRELGVGISIDDFGTGHSSLRYLTRLPITALKIDRAFIQHMATNADDVAIVSTVIALGHNLKLKVIAEGVETEEQSKFLRLLKCDQFQGYLFSKPVPAEQVPALLARGEEKR